MAHASLGGKMRNNIIRYARYKKRFFLSSIMPAYAISVISVIIGIVIALAVISKTPIETIRGFGDAIVISGEETSMIMSFWKCAKFPLIIWLISTSFVGVIIIPIILIYRGFALCCSAAALVFDYGTKGVLLSWASLGITAMISIPCLLIISTNSISSAYGLYSMKYRTKLKAAQNDDFRRSLICILILIPTAYLDYKIVPLLVEYLLR